jgi:hypothetical protein
MARLVFPALKAALLLGCVTGAHGAVISDGSDGAFVAVAGSNVIDLTLPGREDGILNFTTITIPANATVSFKRNALNTPVFMAATGNIDLLGTVNVSAGGNLAGPGGGEGGSAGLGDVNCTAAECRLATGGGGVLGGNAGPNADAGGIKSTPGYAGSGGGMATAGLAADPSRFSRSAPPTAALSQLPAPLVGGSGGGGGGGWMFFGVELGGGAGGDGGGAIQFSTLADILFGGTVLANGANGSYAFTNSGGTGGPGGGGSGGNVQMVADHITVQDSAAVQAVGGWGGCLGTETCDANRPAFSKLNNGGLGFFDLTARTVTLSDAADIQAVLAVHAVPLPSAWLMLAPGVLLTGMMRRRST